MIEIETREEHQRRCGWRKEGGLYLAGGDVVVLSGCKKRLRRTAREAGIVLSRGWAWVDTGEILDGCKWDSMVVFAEPLAGSPSELLMSPGCGSLHGGSLCPLSDPPQRAGLLWIPKAYYPWPLCFYQEASALGIAFRIRALPKGFEIGKTMVLLAHVNAVFNDRSLHEYRELAYIPGIYAAFIPQAVEYVVKGTETEEELQGLVKKGITPVRIERKEAKQGELFQEATGP